MDLRILDALRKSSARLCGAYLPPAPYRYLQHPPGYLKFVPRFVLKKKLKTAAVYAGVNHYLEQHNITALQAARVSDAELIDRLTDCDVDLGVVANFGQRIDDRLLSVPTHGFINYHPSLLPRYRGPAPLGHILLNREKVSGVTWHKVAAQMDEGDILAQAEFDIDPGDTEKDLDRKSIGLAIRLLDPLLADIEAGRARAVPQEASQATYYPKLTALQKKALAELGKRSS